MSNIDSTKKEIKDEVEIDYRKAAREYSEKEAAELASKPNPYAELAKLYGNKQDEEYDEEEDEQLEDEDDQQDDERTITLPVISSSTRPATGKLKNLTEVYKKDDELPNAIICGSCAVYVIQWRGEDIMFTDQGAYQYKDGLWSMSPDKLTSLLNVEIENAAQFRKLPSTNKLIAEASGWIRRQKELNRKYNDIPWDRHGMVPTKGGLVDPRSGVVRPIKPDDYATWRIEAAYDPTATCPNWLRMLEDVFADKTPEERAATISIIQELAGAGLIDDKPRELSRALVFQGGSNFGKSGLIDVLSGLFGREVNSTPIDSLEGTHGTMQFLKRAPWVLHEAFDQRKWSFSSSVKAIITGDPININIKNGALVSQRVTAPIFWGSNHPPQFKEASKAIANRLVVIECNREFFPEKPVGVAKEALRLGLGKPSNLVLKTELPGVLAWALVGLRRALTRGRLELTEKMDESLDEIRADSNFVDEFLSECVVYDPDRRVSAPDFCLAFSAWFMENKGEKLGVPSNDSVGKDLKAMADPKIAISRKELRDMTRRYYAGIILNEAGLNYHGAGYELLVLKGKTTNTTDPRSGVNDHIPAQWLGKEVIKRMRESHMTD